MPPEVAVRRGPVRLLFAPGAGAPSSSDWMTHWAGLLSELGAVTRFDYPYMREGRRRPDRLPALIEAHREALRGLPGEGPVVLVGKSMGSRVGCHLALEERVSALVCLGYPLVGQGKTARLRDQVLRDLRTPVLFVQGTRDRLCPLERLEEVRGEMSAASVVHVVPTGDHSLRVTRAHERSTRSQEEEDRRALGAIRDFLAAQVGTDGGT